MLASTRSFPRRHVAQTADARRDRRDPVQRQVLLGGRDRLRIDVQRQPARGRPQQRRRDRQDPRAAPEIDEALDLARAASSSAIAITSRVDA